MKAETSALPSSSGRRYRIEHANSAPPSGQRKIAPTPAAQPATSSVRRARGVNPKARPRLEPSAAPRPAIGPSGPAEPPHAITPTQATARASGPRSGITPSRRWKASTSWFVPCAGGMRSTPCTSTPEARPPSTGNSRISGWSCRISGPPRSTKRPTSAAVAKWSALRSASAASPPSRPASTASVSDPPKRPSQRRAEGTGGTIGSQGSVRQRLDARRIAGSLRRAAARVASIRRVGSRSAHALRDASRRTTGAGQTLSSEKCRHYPSARH